jgi:hypothetical protein
MAYDPGLIRIDITDAGGTRYGGGPLTTVLSLSRERKLDRIGEIRFPVPATDPRSAYLQIGRRYHIYHRILGDLGEFIHRDSALRPGQHPVLEIIADDLTRELAGVNCLFNRQFSNNYLGTIVTTLLELVAGWSAGTMENVGYTTVEFRGESVLNAIVELANSGGAHFRLGIVARTLDFGLFGSASGIRCVGADIIDPAMEDADELAIISSIEIASEGAGIVNRLIPFGAGEGESQLSLRWTTIADPSYPVHSGSNPDGSTYYYIEDVTSQAAYGLVVYPLVRSDIRPLTNSDVDMTNAANALYNAALAALLARKDPQVSYRMQVKKLVGSLRPGETVCVVYRGVVTHEGVAYKWLDLNSDLTVLSIKDNFAADGSITHELEVSASGLRPMDDTGIVTQMQRDMIVLQQHVQPSMTYHKVGPYERELAPSFDVQIPVRIGSEVLLLHHALLRFATKPLRATATGVASGGGSTQTSESGGGGTSGSSGNHRHVMFSYIDDEADPMTEREYNALDGSDNLVAVALKTNQGTSLHTAGQASDHSHSLPAHTHNVTIPSHSHGLQYGIYDDTHYPQNITLWIDGVDRTAALGGPWALSDAAVGIEVEISTYLNNAAGGLRQTHTITFKCSSGSNNRGVIDAQVDMLCTIQAIAVT